MLFIEISFTALNTNKLAPPIFVVFIVLWCPFQLSLLSSVIICFPFVYLCLSPLYHVILNFGKSLIPTKAKYWEGFHNQQLAVNRFKTIGSLVSTYIFIGNHLKITLKYINWNKNTFYESLFILNLFNSQYSLC